MYIVGVDPGMTTGLALITRTREVRDLNALSDPNEVWQWIASTEDPAMLVVLEDYQGSGPLSSPGHFTIQVVGYIKYTCKAAGVECKVVSPQHRKSRLTQARAIVNAWNDEHKTYWPETHCGDALAHVLVEAGRG
jgi:hypothetical protein